MYHSTRDMYGSAGCGLTWDLPPAEFITWNTLESGVVMKSLT